MLARASAALGIDLNASQLAQFSIYQRELIDWSQRVNLTSILAPDEIDRLHFLDSMSCVLGAPEALRAPGARVIDIGSGAGFPGVPIKIALPSIALTLLEARGKRVAFLEHIIATLGVSGVTVISERAESLGQTPDHREQYDVALTRALGNLAVTAELCMPLLRIGGVLIAPRRGELESEARDAAGAFRQVGGEIQAIIPITLEGLTDGRALVVARKVSWTPARYPRRPGTPAKRPLT